MHDDIPWLGKVSKRRRYLVAASGGADSVTLLELLVGAGFGNLVVCHVDHGLRGAESRKDAEFVRRLARKHELPCEVGKCDVAKRVANGEGSLETVARRARMEFFEQWAAKHRCPRVVLAHHADDQAETALWNLLRGSYGLRGMAEVQAMHAPSGRMLELHRPLLGLRHRQLVEWLSARGNTWREDASNTQPIAVRNRLRNEAFPLLAEISGRDAAAALARGVVDFREMSGLLDLLVDEASVLDPQGRLHLKALRGLHPAVQRHAIALYLQNAGIGEVSRDLLGRATAMINVSAPSTVNLAGGKWLRRRAGRMMVEGEQ